MKDFVNTRSTGLYEDAIGEKNQSYYLEKFEGFDEQGPGLKLSWNWAAFFFGGFWALYRKMYGWFFVWWFLAFMAKILEHVKSTEFHQVLSVVLGVTWLGFTACANSLYHAKVKARIGVAEQKSNSDGSQARKRLSSGGGVHTWVPIVFGGIPIIGIVAGVALPAYQDYAKPKASAEPARANLDLSEFQTPPAKQPATQQNAARANPFDQFDHITARPVDKTNNRPFTYEEAISPKKSSTGTSENFWANDKPAGEVITQPKTQNTVAQEHYRRIYAAHPDADAIYNSPDFRAWVSRYPT